MKVGNVSKPMIITTKKGNKEVAIVKLKSRIEGHRADIVRDLQIIKGMALNSKRQKVLDDWVRVRQKETYVYMRPGYESCLFQYPGWIRHDR